MAEWEGFPYNFFFVGEGGEGFSMSWPRLFLGCGGKGIQPQGALIWLAWLAANLADSDGGGGRSGLLSKVGWGMGWRL